MDVANDTPSIKAMLLSKLVTEDRRAIAYSIFHFISETGNLGAT